MNCDVSTGGKACPNVATAEYDGLPFCARHMTHCPCGDELVGSDSFGWDCPTCSEEIGPFLEAATAAAPVLVGFGVTA